MQKNSILLQEITVEELQELLGSTIKKGISELHKELQTKNYNEELLTREETCQFLKINSTTLWNYTNKGKVIAHGIGSRRYYKRSELLKSLTLLKK
jgi:hypothetical protein